MKLSLWISLRYLFFSKNDSFSKYASLLAIAGLVIGVSSLIITLSIINGFEDTISFQLEKFDGSARIQHILHESFNEKSINISKLNDNENFDFLKFCRNTGIVRKSGIISGVIVEGIVGNFQNKKINENESIIGESLAKMMGVKTGDNIILSYITNSKDIFNSIKYCKLKIIGTFKSGMSEYEKSLIFTSLNTSQNFFNMGTKISGYIVENNSKNINTFEVLSSKLSYPYYLESLKDRHSVLFDWVKAQKLPALILFGMITFVSIINIISTLSMIIIQKSSQIAILLTLGYNREKIKRIFTYLSLIIGFIGSLCGSVFSYIIIYIQDKYHLIPLPSDIYFMDHIPVNFNLEGPIYVSLITIFTCSLISLYPSNSVYKIEPAIILSNE